MAFSDYEKYDGLGLAELVKRGEVAAEELVEAAIERIEARNPALNAVIHRLYDRGRAAARAADRSAPFAGVPFLVKDLMSPLAGAPLGNGSRWFGGFTAPRDCELMARYRRAGLAMIGKTNTPEFGLMPTTEPRAHGPTRNPWNRALTPGGSSGGAGAAVAAGMVPMAHGGDGGGSLRIPGSCCGLFGLKPTRGRLPLGPDAGEAWQGMVVEHAITRSVRDSAALLDASHGPDLGAPYVAPAPARPYLAEIGAPPGRLRIAFSAVPPVAVPVHQDCKVALEGAARLCAELGHEVEEAAPQVDGKALVDAFVVMLTVELAAEIDALTAWRGRKPLGEELENETRLLLALGRSMRGDRFAGALRILDAIGRQVAGFFVRYDALLTPTLAQPPVALGSLHPHGIEAAAGAVLARIGSGRLIAALGGLDQVMAKVLPFIPFTPLFNVTGQPAASLPLHWNAAGLPIGVQVVTRFGDEGTLFRLAAQIETARPWAARRPPPPS
ncbi:MAG: amidase [Alphaproteobacteria bacterium]|nr:amidase [Alphaproteobacteria bacterium]